MISVELFSSLLMIGRSEQFESVRNLPGAGSHHAIVGVASSQHRFLSDFFELLPQSDRGPFLKALAVYEDTVGGLGSVTMLRDLLPQLKEPDHATFDWILQNTKSYWYYANSARSYEEYERIRRTHAEIANENIRREEARQVEDRKRIAGEATNNLSNAVRRGDLKAVQSLILRGADPSVVTPEGKTIVDFALLKGRNDIADALNGASKKRGEGS